MQELTKNIQNNIIAHSIISKEFLKKVRHVLKPEHISSAIARTALETVYHFYDSYGDAPKNAMYEEFSIRIERKEDAEKELHLQYIYKIAESSPPNEDYILSKINKFVRQREIEASLVKAAQELAKDADDSIEKAEGILHDALKSGIKEINLGIDFFALKTPTYYFKQREAKLCNLGVPIIDNAIGGIKKGKLLMALGGYKAGKTWFCIHTARMALMRGLKVLHISHEMDIDEIEQRYDMSFGASVSDEDGKEVEIVMRDDTGGVVVEKSGIDLRPSIYDAKENRAGRRTMQGFGGQLRIQKYPMGTCSMEDIDNLLDNLSEHEDFVPDLIINDYVEIMQLPLGSSVPARDRINQAYIEHKRICDERKITILTVSQITRSALRKGKITQQDLAEDIRKLGNVDIAFGLSCTTKQAKKNIFRLNVLANRSGAMDVEAMVSRNLQIGQLVCQSWEPTKEDDAEDGDSPSTDFISNEKVNMTQVKKPTTLDNSTWGKA